MKEICKDTRRSCSAGVDELGWTGWTGDWLDWLDAGLVGLAGLALRNGYSRQRQSSSTYQEVQEVSAQTTRPHPPNLTDRPDLTG
jgi:hypothetical protein